MPLGADGSVTKTITGTSPASASTAVIGSPVTGLGRAQNLAIILDTLGATGGTLDLVLQTSYDSGATWVDYARPPQLAAGAAAAKRMWTVSKAAEQKTLTTVGSGTSPALAANSIVGGAWGDQMRLIGVAGAGTSAGAAQTVTIGASE